DEKRRAFHRCWRGDENESNDTEGEHEGLLHDVFLLTVCEERLLYPSGVKREVATAAAIVFISSFCLLVIELVAGRILAPHVGVSLYTWTSIIGIVLAGISIGAWIGGVLADRYSPAAILPILLLLSAAASFAVLPMTNLFATHTLPLPEDS